MPNAWIEGRVLCEFRWATSLGSDNLSALMTFMVLLHHMEPDTGEGHLTYDKICAATSLSRVKVANGLAILEERGLIQRKSNGRSTYRVENYQKDQGWAKLPASGLYRHGAISAFTNFHLRNPAELEALKLYYLFASRRSRETNMAHISYDLIEEMIGINRSNIRRGLTMLAANSLVHIDHLPSKVSEHGISNAYRLVHLDTFRHMGTSGRGQLGDFI